MCHERWHAQHELPLTAEAIAVDGGELPVLRAAVPDGVDAIGACVLATDIYGPVPFYQEVARQLAAAGVATSVVDLFWREGPLPELTRDAEGAPLGWQIVRDAPATTERRRAGTRLHRDG